MPVIVIIGGGIMGTCTAYYLTRHPKFDPEKYRIVLIESEGVGCAASGKAGGLLARDWHQKPTASLAELSFDLHAELAKEWNGRTAWDFRHLKALSVDFQANLHKTKKNQSQECDWIDHTKVKECQVLGLEDSIAQCHPYKFTTFLMQKAIESGVELLIGHVLDIQERSIAFVQDGIKKTLSTDMTIVCAGPWTSKLLPKVQIYGHKAHSITIKTEKPTAPFALFTEMTLKSGKRGSPEFYSRPDELYVCGESVAEEVPEKASHVQPDPAKSRRLWDFTKELSTYFSDAKIECEQACFLPISDYDCPLIGSISDKLYVASGHSCWGICLAPGTGKVMSELILDGVVTSADIRQLNPKLYL
jgi:glycine/D-amino acid oxidase-like deaminating enzyme